jgi:hypothetical protein
MARFQGTIPEKRVVDPPERFVGPAVGLTLQSLRGSRWVVGHGVGEGDKLYVGSLLQNLYDARVGVGSTFAKDTIKL